MNLKIHNEHPILYFYLLTIKLTIELKEIFLKIKFLQELINLKNFCFKNKFITRRMELFFFQMQPAIKALTML